MTNSCGGKLILHLDLYCQKVPLGLERSSRLLRNKPCLFLYPRRGKRPTSKALFAQALGYSGKIIPLCRSSWASKDGAIMPIPHWQEWEWQTIYLKGSPLAISGTLYSTAHGLLHVGANKNKNKNTLCKSPAPFTHRALRFAFLFLVRV